MWHRGVWSDGFQNWKEIFTNFCIFLYNSTAGYVSGCRFNLLKASPVKALKTGVVKKCPIWGHILESEKYFFSLGSFGKSFHIVEFEYYERCASQKQKQVENKECTSTSAMLFDHFIYIILHVKLTKCHIKLLHIEGFSWICANVFGEVELFFLGFFWKEC